MEHETPAWMSGGSIDYEAGIEETKKEMFAAEDAFIDAGFSEEHWLLIRTYISAAIMNNQLVVSKSAEVAVDEEFGADES